MDELKKYLIKQQYPYKLVEDGLKKASELDREELINPKPRNENNVKILSLVTTYNPRNKNITPVVRQLNNILKTDVIERREKEKYFIHLFKHSLN